MTVSEEKRIPAAPIMCSGDCVYRRIPKYPIRTTIRTKSRDHPIAPVTMSSISMVKPSRQQRRREGFLEIRRSR